MGGGGNDVVKSTNTYEIQILPAVKDFQQFSFSKPILNIFRWEGNTDGFV
jgi:hypothetical protein